jgi:hypothetical protein
LGEQTDGHVHCHGGHEFGELMLGGRHLGFFFSRGFRR